MESRWRSYTSYLLEQYGQRVYRIGIDGGFSCPNRKEHREGGCIYCDARGSSAVYQRPDEQSFTKDPTFVPHIDALTDYVHPQSFQQRLISIDQQVQRGRDFIARRYHTQAMSIYFQAFTNTFDRPDRLRILYDRALSDGPYVELIISTRPDCLDDEIIALLASYQNRVQQVWVELGLQSGNDETLEWIGRGHTVRDFSSAVHRLHQAGLPVSAHVILGFPQEGPEAINNTAQVIADSHVEAVKIHNLHVVAGTRLFELYQKDPFTVPSRQAHVQNAIQFLRRIPSSVIVQRFISDTPAHRLAAPRDFGNKNQFLRDLSTEMERLDVRQGDLL
jgi:radical SAM protein (TIGR01212 family)